MRTLGRLLGRMLLALGWVAFAVLLTLFLAEETGFLTWVARRWIDARAGPLAADLEIDHVSLCWFDPRLEFHGLRLGLDGDAVRVHEASLALETPWPVWFLSALADRQLRVSEIEVRGGHVRLSQPLLDRMRRLAARFPRRAPGEMHTASIPSITVRDLDLDLDTLQFGRLPLGRVDATVRTGTSGSPVLRGRLVPSLSSAPGESGEVFIAGQEVEPGAFDVSASAAGVPLSTDYLPNETVLDALRPFAPRGMLALQASGQLSFDGKTPPHAQARLSLTDGRLLLADGTQQVEGLILDLEAGYAPESSGDLWNLGAWDARARATARWMDVPFLATARLADEREPGRWLACRLHVPRLPCRHELVDLAGAHVRDEKFWRALEPRGSVELWAALAFPRAWLPGEPLTERVQTAFEIGLGGNAGAAFHGWPRPGTAILDQGFPLPIDGLEGSVVGSFQAGLQRPLLLGIVDVAGRPENGSVRVAGTVASAPIDAAIGLPGRGYAEIDLRIHADGLPVDGRLRAALMDLSGAVHPADTWEPFDPSGGQLTADLRVVRTVEMERAAVDLRLDVQDVACSWSQLPIPAQRVKGRLEFLSDGISKRALGAVLEGTVATASEVRIGLRYQTDPNAPAPTGAPRRLDEMSWLAVRAGRLSLTGDDKKALVTRFPFIGEVMDPLAPRGFADVTYARSRPAAGAPAITTAEVSALDAEVTPRVFSIPVSGVIGRVLVTSVEEPGKEARTETLVAPLAGTFGGDVRVAATATFPRGTVRMHGAGIDFENKSLRGALVEAIGGAGDAPDLTSIRVEGTFDAAGEILLGDSQGTQGRPSEPGEAREPRELDQQYRLYLRENSLLASKSFRLDRLRGILELNLKEKLLLGRRVEASLADTPLQLDEMRFTTTAKGFELTTRIPRVENLPLNRDHLGAFVDEKTLDALLGPLGWRGSIDVEDGEIRITGPRQGDTRLEFRGRITPADMQVLLGLPLSVRTASVIVEQLVYEGGQVRAVARIKDLFGTVAGRELADVGLLLTYVEPRLSIESLEGELEGGAIRPLGEGAERGGTVFSIDLEDPFPFHLALDLHGIELSGLLRGLLATSFATAGKLDCRLRLTGDTQNVLGIQGTGSVHLRESRLWSVPVFRALFYQLGMDDQAVFDRMAANIRVKNGVIWTDDISVHSPILLLVGKGSLDFDGTIREDLQVRYALIDRLGPLTRLLYAIQKELLSVEIRGDLARPKVIMKSPWSRLFSRSGSDRDLPLPPLSPLPPRF